MLLIGIVAFAAACFVLIGTRNGIGESDDSSHYLSAAMNVRAGNGLDVAFSSSFDRVPVAKALAGDTRVPLTHFPPGYPMAIAAADLVTPGGVAAAARVVGAATLALLVIVGATLAIQLGARGALAPAGVGAAVAASPALLHISRWAMSDTLAATLAVGAIAVAAVPHRREHRRRVLVIAATVAALAAMTRYAGAAAAVAVVLVLDDSSAPPRRRLRDAISVVMVTVVSLAAFITLGKIRHGDGARPVAWHPLGLDEARAFVGTIGSWVIGDRSDTAMRFAAIVVIALVAFATRRLWRMRSTLYPATRSPEKPRVVPSVSRVGASLGALALAHMAILIITRTWLDADISADRRLLLPIEIVAVVVVASWFVTMTRVHRTFAFTVLVALVGARAFTPTNPLPEGIGSPPPPHAPNELHAYVLALRADTVLVTNAPEALWRETRRGSIYAPDPYAKLSGQFIDDRRLAEQLGEMGRLAGARGAVLVVERLVLFGITIESPRVLSPLQIERYLPCAGVKLDVPAGVLYDLRPCAT